MIDIHASCMPINYGLIARALALSGLEWHVSLAQLVSLEICAYTQPPTIAEVVLDSEVAIEMVKHDTKYTLWGLPMVIDKSMHDCHIELRDGEKVILRIDGLAIPCGMETQL